MRVSVYFAGTYVCECVWMGVAAYLASIIMPSILLEFKA